MSKFEELLAKYKESRHSMTAKQLTEAERELWKAYCFELPGAKTGNRRDFFRKYFEDHYYSYENRQVLLEAGSAIDKLWDLFDQKMTHFTVIRLYRHAKKLSLSNGIPLNEAVASVLEKFSNGMLLPSPDGKLYRRGNPTKKTISNDQPRPSLVNSEVDSGSAQNTRSKKFLLELTVLTDEYLKSSFGDLGIDETAAVSISRNEFVSFIREAVEDLKRRVSAIRVTVRKESRKQKISREQFRMSCEVLNLPYSYGQKIDLRFCKKLMLKRASPLHPDRNNGSHAAQSEYQAVIEAYTTLEKYAEGLNVNETGERNHEGR